jgi:hypothetical protein
MVLLRLALELYWNHNNEELHETLIKMESQHHRALFVPPERNSPSAIELE